LWSQQKLDIKALASSKLRAGRSSKLSENQLAGDGQLANG